MVGTWRQRRAILVTILLIVAVGIVILYPDIIVERSDPYVRLVNRAVARHYAEQGRYPRSLTEAQPYLHNGTIARFGENEYRVEIEDDHTVHVLEARYRIDQNGMMEELYARVIDERRK